MAKLRRDLTGHVFGRWQVLSQGPNDKNGAAQWYCLCACGNNRLVRAAELVRGQSTSCGHENRNRFTTHGLAYAPEYTSWKGMRRRCLNPKNPGFKNYGGRGIAICQRWLDSFEAFLADMGPRPSPEHSIERIDNDGPYSKENCEWATDKAQSRNRRSSVIVTYNGVTQCLAAWSETTGISVYTLWYRYVQAQWSIERTLTTPVRQHHHAS